MYRFFYRLCYIRDSRTSYYINPPYTYQSQQSLQSCRSLWSLHISPALATMASPNGTSSSKKRLGRRRLPPLEPGPALQFVIASHPDQFRAGKTMRHVRSHVMYKHRTDRKIVSGRGTVGVQRSTSALPSTASSPVLTGSDTSLSDRDCLLPPQVRPRSTTWTGHSPQHMPHASPPSTLSTLIHQIVSLTQGAYARSAPPVFEGASAFPFPTLYGIYGDPLQNLKLQYIDSCGFRSEGLSVD